MKPHPDTVLALWPSDSDEEKISLTVPDRENINFIFQKAKKIHGYLKQLENIDENSEELYDTSYSDSHFISGFGEITGSKKISHLGELAELIADIARNIQDYSQHSMIYLLEVILGKLVHICEDFLQREKTNLDISDVVSECSTYLKAPAEKLSEKEKKSIKIDVEPKLEPLTRPEESSKPKVIDKVTSISKVAFEEEQPEELNIPPEKIGLISDFCEEAWESLQVSENLLIELENNPDSSELINELFRAVHTVKGGSRLIEIKKIESLSHELETVLDEVRSNRRQLTPGLIDISLVCIKRINEITDEVASRGPIMTKVNDLILSLQSGHDKLGEDLSSFNAGNKISESLFTGYQPNQNEETDIPKVTTVTVSREEAIKVSAEKLDSVLNASSEVYITRIRLENDQKNLAESLDKVNETILNFRKNPQVRHLFDEEIVPPVLNEMEGNSSCGTKNKYKSDGYQEGILFALSEYQKDLSIGLERLSIHHRSIQKNIEDLEVLSSRLQSGAMNFRMVPVSNLFNRFPAQVRDIARQIGKRVELKISGAETELDKILINQLSDPLLHIIRNSIDHGIEEPKRRTELKKQEVGQIFLRAFYLGSNAIIEVEDDGKGIDKKTIVKKAIEKGLLNENKKGDLSEKEIFDLIFEPGFSSAEAVTELSGRGVGMDVVKTAINRIQGSIKVESNLNSGTKITMRLPLTLAVVGILLVAENGYQFAFPILNVEEIIHINLTQDVKKVNETLVYNFRGELVTVNYLSDFLEYPKKSVQEKENFLIVLNDGESKIGVLVDQVLGQQSVLLKQLGTLIEVAPYVIGCTILSNSKLVLILNVLELAQSKSAEETAIVFEKIERRNKLVEARNLRKILMVDDSAIQRKRVSDFIQASGYKIDQAEDGYDALNKSKKADFDAFCVDIQMPLMDGYELIARLREQENYENIPVFVISGIHMDRDSQLIRLKELNVINFYEKPIDLDQLLSDLDENILPSLEELKQDSMDA